jgi:hypothetical protein
MRCKIRPSENYLGEPGFDKQAALARLQRLVPIPQNQPAQKAA